MGTPQIALVHNRRKKEGKSSIEIRITLEGKQKYISTGISVRDEEWKSGEVINREDALQLNEELSRQVLTVRKAIMEMSEEGNLDIFQIQDKLEKKKEQNQTFLEFCTKRANIRKYGKRKDSRQRYDRFLRLFKEWGGIVSFDDITEDSIISYDRYLQKRGLKPYSKWNNYHRFLNSFIIDAVCEGLLHRNPYKWVNIDRGDKVSKTSRYLTPDEFQRIRFAPMPTKSLERIRDVFVFQTYTCLSYTDLKNFCAERLHSIKDMKVYIGKRNKTGRQFTIPLLNPVLEILEKYDMKLPVISNVNYNLNLKVVAQAAGVDKPVSSHWARHTGATMLLNSGVDMRIVSKICGHSSMRITEQVYAKLLDETVVDAISDIEKPPAFTR